MLTKIFISLTLICALAFYFIHFAKADLKEKPADPTLLENIKKLSTLEFHVTQENGTEPPFKNKFWDNKKEGIYVDIVSGEPLFSSQDKYDSGTGWPSFSKPVLEKNIVTKVDKSLFSERTEVRSKKGNSHLGHVFNDGPAPTGLRYCMNSAALRFIPKSDLEKEGYGEFLKLFSQMEKTKSAIFAGGCFWCMEPPFDAVKGVIATTSGYAGGKKKNPTYEEVSSGTTGHKEVLQVTYDPTLVSYEQLLEVYWKNIDPFDARGQFCDKGEQYQSAIFANSDNKKTVETFLAKQEKSLGKKVATKILDETEFYPAEGYHQDYYKKNPVRYKYYRYRCGRDQRLKDLWGSSGQLDAEKTH